MESFKGMRAILNLHWRLQVRAEQERLIIVMSKVYEYNFSYQSV